MKFDSGTHCKLGFLCIFSGRDPCTYWAVELVTPGAGLDALTVGNKTLFSVLPACDLVCILNGLQGQRMYSSERRTTFYVYF
jgi:hypothetical protein